jgi:predicted Zn-dependent peptidase
MTRSRRPWGGVRCGTVAVGAWFLSAEPARAATTGEPPGTEVPQHDSFSGWEKVEQPCALLLRKSLPSMGERARLSVVVPHARDPRGRKELAHLVEHLDLDRGGDRERVELAAQGVELNGQTHTTFTTYYVEGPSPAMPRAAEVLLQRVFAPSETTEAEVAAQLAPLRVEKELPPPAWWTAFGYGSATTRSLEAITPSDVDRFRRKWNRPSSAIFLVVGDVDAVPASVFEGLGDHDCSAPQQTARAEEPADPRPHRTRVEDRVTSEVQVEWQVERPDDRDLALMRLTTWILVERLTTELRYRQHLAYTPMPYSSFTGGRGHFGVKVEVEGDALGLAQEVVRQEVRRLSSVDTLSEADWEVDRAMALTQLTWPRDAKEVVAEVQQPALLRRAIDPVVPVVAAVDRAAFTEWVADATRPERATWTLTRGVPDLGVLDVASYVGCLVGLFGLGQLLLRLRRRQRPGAVRCIWPLERPIGGWGVLATAAAPFAVLAPFAAGAQDAIRQAALDTTVDLFALMALMNGVPAATTAALACVATLLPRDVLEGEGQVVLRTFGAYRWAFTREEVVEVRRERLVDLALRGKWRFRVVPWPAPWRTGTSLHFADGGVVLLHGASVELAFRAAGSAPGADGPPRDRRPW